jgi:sporulation protein YlmC with PRC-barrel domain
LHSRAVLTNNKSLKLAGRVKMRWKELSGKEVLDMNANNIGKLVDIDFDISNGLVDTVFVRSGLFREKAVKLDQIDKVGDKITLKITKDDLG